MSWFQSPEKTRGLVAKRRRDELSYLKEAYHVLKCTISKTIEVVEMSALYYASPKLLYLYVVIRVMTK